MPHRPYLVILLKEAPMPPFVTLYEAKTHFSGLVDRAATWIDRVTRVRRPLSAIPFASGAIVPIFPEEH